MKKKGAGDIVSRNVKFIGAYQNHTLYTRLVYFLQRMHYHCGNPIYLVDLGHNPAPINKRFIRWSTRLKNKY